MSVFWGDPVQSTVPGEGAAKVDTMHEGVWLEVRHPDGGSGSFFSAEEARQIARNLERAAAQWEED